MKYHTIKNYDEFKFVMNNGKKIFKEYGIVFKLGKDQFCKKFPKYAKISGNLYGIMATKKLGNAVKRNFIKRKIRIVIKKEIFEDEVWIILGKKLHI